MSKSNNDISRLKIIEVDLKNINVELENIYSKISKLIDEKNTSSKEIIKMKKELFIKYQKEIEESTGKKASIAAIERAINNDDNFINLNNKLNEINNEIDKIKINLNILINKKDVLKMIIDLIKMQHKA